MKPLPNWGLLIMWGATLVGAYFLSLEMWDRFRKGQLG